MSPRVLFPSKDPSFIERQRGVTKNTSSEPKNGSTSGSTKFSSTRMSLFMKISTSSSKRGANSLYEHSTRFFVALSTSTSGNPFSRNSALESELQLSITDSRHLCRERATAAMNEGRYFSSSARPL